VFGFSNVISDKSSQPRVGLVM